MAILQDAWFALGELEEGYTVAYRLHRNNTGVYCFVIKREIKFGGGCPIATGRSRYFRHIRLSGGSSKKCSRAFDGSSDALEIQF